MAVLAGFTLSTKIGITILAAFVSIFVPVAPIIHTMLVVIVIDAFTGIGADIKRHNIPLNFFSSKNWTHISSTKLGLTISKMLAYSLLIISAFLIDQYIITTDVHWFTKIVGVSIALRELLSIVENVEVISGRTIIGTITNILRFGWKTGIADSLDGKHLPPEYNDDNYESEYEEEDES